MIPLPFYLRFTGGDFSTGDMGILRPALTPVRARALDAVLLTIRSRPISKDTLIGGPKERAHASLRRPALKLHSGGEFVRRNVKSYPTSRRGLRRPLKPDAETELHQALIKAACPCL